MITNKGMWIGNLRDPEAMDTFIRVLEVCWRYRLIRCCNLLVSIDEIDGVYSWEINRNDEAQTILGIGLKIESLDECRSTLKDALTAILKTL